MEGYCPSCQLPVDYRGRCDNADCPNHGAIVAPPNLEVRGAPFDEPLPLAFLAKPPPPIIVSNR